MKTAALNRIQTLLVADDDEATVALLSDVLKREGYQVFEAKSGAEAIHWLQHHSADLLLLDLHLGDLTAPAMIEQLRQQGYDLPFIIITGQGDERTAAQMMRQGALDYVMKGAGLLDFLPEVVRRAFAVVVHAGELRKANALLRKSEEHLRRIHESLSLAQSASRCGVWDWNILQDTTYVSPQLCELYGLPPDTHMSCEAWFKAIYPEDRQRIETTQRELMRSGENWTGEFRVLHPTRGERWLAGYGKLTRNPEGRPANFAGVTIDITEQRRAELAQRELLIRFEATFENAAVGIAHVAPDGRWLRMNSKLCEITGYSREELLKTSLSEITHAEDVELDCMQARKLLAGEIESYSIEKRSVRKGGGTIWINVSVSLVRDGTGQPEYFIRVVEDITERKRAATLQIARDAAEAANRAKDRFLAVLSHELRTPLAPVLMCSNTMANDPALPKEARDSAAMIYRNIELQAQLIDDLLDQTRILRGKLQLRMGAVDVHEKIRHVIEMCAGEIALRQIRLEVNPSAIHSMVHADSTRLQQVLWNLLKNAVKFTPPNGTISVSTCNICPESIHLELSDTGVGIEPQLLPHVFEAFEQGGDAVTREFGGLGLGLAISKAIVEMHGGTIAVESQGVGKGATFTLDLPTVNERHLNATTKLTRDASQAPERELRILIVEDHSDTARMMARLLTRQGHHVHAASRVADAVLAAHSVTFDLLISDLGLPDGSGYELMEQLGAMRPPRAIAMSGFGTEDDLRRSREAGFAEHLIKPVAPETLNAVIRSVTTWPGVELHAALPSNV